MTSTYWTAGRSATGWALTASDVDEGVDENEVIFATGMPEGNDAFCNPLVIRTSPR